MSNGSGLFQDEGRSSKGKEERTPRRMRGRRYEYIVHPRLYEGLGIGTVVWSLYGAACVCTAYRQEPWAFGDGPSPSALVPGWAVLAVGWVPPYCIPWSANLWLLIGWIAYIRGRAQSAAVCGGIGAMLGLSAFAMPSSEVAQLLSGYYLWQASLTVFAVAAYWHWWRRVIRSVSVPDLVKSSG